MRMELFSSDDDLPKSLVVLVIDGFRDDLLSSEKLVDINGGGARDVIMNGADVEVNAIAEPTAVHANIAACMVRQSVAKRRLYSSIFPCQMHFSDYASFAWLRA